MALFNGWRNTQDVVKSVGNNPDTIADRNIVYRIINNDSRFPSNYGVGLSVGSARKGKGDGGYCMHFYVNTAGGLYYQGTEENKDPILDNWIQVLDSKMTIPVEMGGTSSKTRQGAAFNINFIGRDFIANTSEDTVQRWSSESAGFGYAFFSDFRMLDQPGQFMIVLNIPYYTDLFQIGIVQPNGFLYFRNGNGSGSPNGWNTTWTQIATVSHLSSYVTKSYVDGKVSASAIQQLLTGGQVSVIKSVHRGIISILDGQTVGTANISSVDTNKSVVLYGGSIYGNAGNSNNNSNLWDARLVLKSATQVEAARVYAATQKAYVPYQVIEFY